MSVPECRVNWRLFDLEPPEPGECRERAAYRVTQGCAHEHVTSALACGKCVDMMRSFEPLDRWGCGWCLPDHQCPAPVLVETLGRSTT